MNENQDLNLSEEVRDESSLNTSKTEAMTPNDDSIKRKKKSKKAVVILLMVLFIIAIVVGIFIHMNNKEENKSITTEKEEVYSQYRMSGNQLDAFDLYFLQLENNRENKIYSPLSIKYALAMLQEGANGESKEQINNIIGSYQSRKYTNSSNMSFANAMFIRQSFQENINESYMMKLKNKFNAEVIYDTFSTPDNVNNWVANKTFGLIDHLFDNISDNQFFLVNALAIDMEWNQKIQATWENFKDSYTVSFHHENYQDYISLITDERYLSLPFNNNSINAKAVQFGATINNYDIVKELGEENIRATITEEYKTYLENSDGSSCEMDNPNVEEYVNQFIQELDSNYKQIKTSTDFKIYTDDYVKVFAKELKEYDGTTLEYIGIMPTQENLDEYIKNTDQNKINAIINNLKEITNDNFTEGKVTKITGKIPLFQFDYELSLKDDLKKLGIVNVFDESKADITNITSVKGAYINSASHKANIEFSNEGIKAAAVTASGGAGAATCGFEHLYEVPVEVIDLTFDRPYMFMIRDKSTKEVWFMGTVYEPIENNS